MAFAAKNVLAFFRRYPLFAPFRDRALARAAEYAYSGNISGGDMFRVMGFLSPLFLYDLTHNPEQIILAFSEGARVSPDLNGQVLAIICFRKIPIFYGYRNLPVASGIPGKLDLYDMNNHPDIARITVDYPSGLTEIYIDDPHSDGTIYFDNIEMPSPSQATRMQGRDGDTGRLNCWRCIFFKIPPP